MKLQRLTRNIICQVRLTVIVKSYFMTVIQGTTTVNHGLYAEELKILTFKNKASLQNQSNRYKKVK